MEDIASGIEGLILEDRHEVCKRFAAVNDDGLIDPLGLRSFHDLKLLGKHGVLDIPQRLLMEVIQTQFAPRDALWVCDDFENVLPHHFAVGIKRMDAAGAPDASVTLGEGEDLQAIGCIC